MSNTIRLNSLKRTWASLGLPEPNPVTGRTGVARMVNEHVSEKRKVRYARIYRDYEAYVAEFAQANRGYDG